MTTQYFRITAYHPDKNFSMIMDSNGMFEKLWQFSSELIQKGFKVLEISNGERFIDVNITIAEAKPDKLFVQAHATGKPETTTHTLNGTTYRAVRIADKIYVPDKDRRA